MTLQTYLVDEKIKPAQFARRLKVNASTVHRLISGERKPSGKLAAAIERETGGRVRLSDFFEAADDQLQVAETE